MCVDPEGPGEGAEDAKWEVGSGKKGRGKSNVCSILIAPLHNTISLPEHLISA